MIGADVVDISRMERAVAERSFVSRIFTEAERAYALSKLRPAQTFAGIFAAKEAVAKLSGKGLRGFFLTDIEVIHDEFGAPKIELHGKAKELFNAPVFVSISHDGNYAFAVASFERASITPVLPGKEITDGDFALMKRERFTHKGDYGRVFVIGGCGNMIGAPLICAQAAVRSGAGLTTLCVPTSLLDAYRARVKEIMLTGLRDEAGFLAFDEDALKTIVSRADAIIVGMGAGNCPSMNLITQYLLQNFSGTLVLDADALNALSLMPQLLLAKRRCELILTPHVGEFNRLAASLETDCAPDMALKTGAVVAYKSAYTLVTDGITSYKITSGCAAMAKGGSGDTLAGIIGAYSCRTIPLIATALACHHFGRCGEKAAALKGENAVTASDIIDCL